MLTYALVDVTIKLCGFSSRQGKGINAMKKQIVFYGVCATIILWFILSTIEVWAHNLKGNPYCKANVWVLMTAHTTDMRVVDCQGKRDDSYQITVIDVEGNMWAYWADSARDTGSVVRITTSGNEIINAR